LKILSFTGSRAEYYILRPLFKLISLQSDIDIELIVTGGIISESQNKTVNDIEKDNIKIRELLKIPNIFSSNSSHSETIGYLCLELPKIIRDYNPDLAIVYADRYESFAFAIAASHCNVPVLHLEAGDVTEGGTYDDYIRHCISKMSHLFCTSTIKGKEVVKRLGEESWRVIQSGLLSYDDMALITNEDQNIILKRFNINQKLPVILATMHPLPKDIIKTKKESENFFDALKQISYENDVRILITGPNSDFGSDIVREVIQKRIKEIKNATFYESLGGFNYQTIMSLTTKNKVIVCGNSSSIIKEAPFYNAHSLNVGDRQNSRESASTQHNCVAEKHEIVKSIKKLILKKHFNSQNPYFVKNSSEKVLKFIKYIFSTYTKKQILDKKWSSY
tara:strand:- start:311 stop:1483 length:1173 start_codon:yes stop_codon:yes gene_type:complete